MRVLVVAPHMDDEALGMGGTILRHVAGGDDVCVCFVADRVYDHTPNRTRSDEERRCAIEAQRHLGYREAIFLELPDERLDACTQDVIIPLERVVQAVQPDVAYLPHRGDNHQDHLAVFHAAQVVFRPSAVSVRRLLSYEVPSSTEQAPAVPETAFLPNYFVDISAELDRKLAAVACYTREARPFPHPRSPEALRALAVHRGVSAGFTAAEAFVLLRERMPA